MCSKFMMITVPILLLLCSHAKAETIHIQNWPGDLSKVPCSAWKINSDGTVSQTGTIIADNPPLTFIGNTFASDRLETKIIKNLCGEI